MSTTGWLLLLYFLPLLLGLLLLFPKLKKIYTIHKHTGDTGLTEYLKSKSEPIKEHLTKGRSIDELDNLPSYGISTFLSLLQLIWFFYVLPVAVLRWAILLTVGVEYTWRSLLDEYDIWAIIVLIVSFSLSSTNSSVSGMLLAVLVILVYTHSTIDIFRKNGNSIKVFQMGKHKLRIKGLLFDWLGFSAGFSALYYGLSNYSPSSFSKAISIKESLFYSFYLITNFSDDYLTATSDTSKWLSFFESMCGYWFSIIIISIFISVWFRNNDVTVEKNG